MDLRFTIADFRFAAFDPKGFEPYRQSRLKPREIGNRKSAIANHRNCPAYHATICEPKSNAAIDPIPKKTPNGSSICMFRLPWRNISAIPMIEPDRTLMKIVKIVSRHP